MPLTSIIHGYVSHQIDGTTFPAFSLWKAAEWVAQLTHRLNLPRSPLPARVNLSKMFKVSVRPAMLVGDSRTDEKTGGGDGGGRV